ncbi:MAG: universal stress protein [Sphingobacteriaceae bacterium]|nr:universal stress protein [Sphingobacteriaceae bacterium]
MKIIVTTDFSTSSKSGIRFALQLAAQTKCELTFYNVFEGVENNSWNIKGSTKKKLSK